MKFTPLTLLVLTAVASASLVACGGGNSASLTGVFLDAQVVS
jgi:hypothetical protein